MNNIQDLQNNDIEKAILRLLINKVDLLAEIDGRLTSNDFYSIAHQTIFTALCEMYDKGLTVDLITLTDYLTKTGRFENVGSITYLTDLYEGIMNKAGLNEYVEIIKGLSYRRYLWRYSQRVGERVHDKTISVYELAGKAADALEKLNRKKEGDKKEKLVVAYEELTSEQKQGIDTGFNDIDGTLKGMKKGNLLILAGRPAMGKTAFALNIIKNMASAGQKVLFYSLEMSAEEIYKRLIIMVSEMNESVIKAQIAKDNATQNNSFSDDVKQHRDNESKRVWLKLQAGMNQVYNWNLQIIESGRCDIQDLRMRAKIQRAKSGLDCIVIDYLQLMRADNFRDNRVGEISYITRELKLLAKELEMPILVLSQLSRAVESRNDKRPLLSDLRDSGSIEQDADVVMMIYRDQYYNEKGDDWTEVRIAKNRHGGNVVARLQFTPELGKFTAYRKIAGKEVKGIEFPR